MQRVVPVVLVAQAHLLAAMSQDAQCRLCQGRHGAHAFFVAHQKQVLNRRLDASLAWRMALDECGQLLALLFQGGVEDQAVGLNSRHGGDSRENDCRIGLCKPRR
ncbi:hypothetical protein D3C79_819850 [compost metagenome]